MTRLPILSAESHLGFVLFVFFFAPIFVSSQFSPAERAVLLDVKRAFGDPEILQGWNASSSPCTWMGVMCSVEGSVTGIVLEHYNLSGEIPAAISLLENLSFLNFGYNLLGGSFPAAVLNCSRIQHLDLSQNLFVGTIPDSVGDLRSLQYLDLSANNFSGSIPPAIGKLTKLKVLYLQSNLFNGSFPVEISNLINLEVLGLAYNSFSPALVPPEFGKLEKIKFIWMKETNIYGKIPESLVNCSSLEHLDLSINNLEGEIPGGLFLLKNLSHLYLFQNQFSGSFPVKIESLNMVELDVAMNNLTGTIPEAFGKLGKLELLHLFANQFHGEIPSSLGLIPNMKNFRIFKNNFNGVLPPEMGFHSELEAFEVSENGFTGKLPENLCAGGALSGVVAFHNKLTGEIPKSLESCQSLRTVQLFGNGFSGEVPPGLYTLQDMISIMLSDNSFSGQLPRRIAWNFTRLEISNNKFSGVIPAGVSSWESLVVFKASNNIFSGSIPVELTSLRQLDTMEIDGNSISGHLPSEIISWRSLTTLKLQRNSLSGPIPPAFGSLPRLLELDLSQNQFSGEIPPELGHLKLTSLNLSSNQLKGQIPHEFDNMAYENSFLGNPNICAMNSISNLPRCNSKLHESKKPSRRFVAVVVVLAVILFLLTLLMTMFLVRDYRRKKLNRDLASWKLTSFQRLDFSEINILSSLTDNNMIGSGGSGKIYRVPVDRGGHYVAVKRICNDKKLDQIPEKEFLSEIQILGSIRHANIVKLLCCISNDDSKLIVYEYMENQSLDKWLHRKKTTAYSSFHPLHNNVLDWPSRLRIAIGAAQGLLYMHHGCTPPIIHRDVKSSNILLDSNFIAKIADFGLARTLIKKDQANTMSAIAGSFGYMAPEYAYTTKLNEKIDVYGFGVVLLELTTGREPNCGDENSCLAQWAWKQYGEENPIADVLDKGIQSTIYMEEMISVFKLGLICTSSLPRNRPTMKEVVQILYRCESHGSSHGNTARKEYDVAPLLHEDKYIRSYKCCSRKIMDLSDNSLMK